MLVRLAGRGHVRIYDTNEIEELTLPDAFLDEFGFPHEKESCFKFDATSVTELKFWAETGGAR